MYICWYMIFRRRKKNKSHYIHFKTKISLSLLRLSIPLEMVRRCNDWPRERVEEKKKKLFSSILIFSSIVIRHPSDAIQKCIYNAHACFDISWFFLAKLSRWQSKSDALPNSFNFLPSDVIDAICNFVDSPSTSVPACANAKTMQNHQIQWKFSIFCCCCCCGWRCHLSWAKKKISCLTMSYESKRVFAHTRTPSHISVSHFRHKNYSCAPKKKRNNT